MIEGLQKIEEHYGNLLIEPDYHCDECNDIHVGAGIEIVCDRTNFSFNVIPIQEKQNDTAASD
jgi:hypothetical protein